MELRSAAKILIRRKTDGRYLVLTSSKWEENPLRSQAPDLPGGLVEDGETITEGLQRELQEEIGSRVDEHSLRLVFASTHVNDEENRSTTFLLYFAEVDELEVTLSWEHESFEWVDAEAVMNLNIREPYPEIFAHFKTVGLLV